ncbi:hypothetical protein E2C01_020953 [Portunus trituberculatus]|uniref:Uncharacterized protein n=1 Tax=Portunus trituberculatus TaxID=210409 RepID=A0A5B7E199_PORTR|nr:hypothetical protein [Portunus trituberculatus]
MVFTARPRHLFLASTVPPPHPSLPRTNPITPGNSRVAWRRGVPGVHSGSVGEHCHGATRTLVLVMLVYYVDARKFRAGVAAGSVGTTADDIDTRKARWGVPRWLAGRCSPPGHFGDGREPSSAAARPFVTAVAPSPSSSPTPQEHITDFLFSS